MKIKWQSPGEAFEERFVRAAVVWLKYEYAEFTSVPGHIPWLFHYYLKGIAAAAVRDFPFTYDALPVGLVNIDFKHE